jgi:hypothetical protein
VTNMEDSMYTLSHPTAPRSGLLWLFRFPFFLFCATKFNLYF